MAGNAAGAAPASLPARSSPFCGRWTGLARHQLPDGNWSLRNYTHRCTDASCSGPGSVEADAAATAMGLLPFLAHGETHKNYGKHVHVITNGLVWLVRHQKPDGDLSAGAEQQMYAHALATITLCEAFGMTKDTHVGAAAQAAVDFIVAAQNRQTGGWRVPSRRRGGHLGLGLADHGPEKRNWPS